MTLITITGEGIGIDHVPVVARRRARIRIAPQALERVRRAREILDQVAASGQQIYGLNTGLGANLRTVVTATPARSSSSFWQAEAARLGIRCRSRSYALLCLRD